MSLIHHQITTRSEPLPPILCPPEAKKDIPPLEKFTSLVDTWLDHGAPDRLRLEGICFEEFERILEDLYWRGLKPRYDWDQESRTAVLRMPTGIHEEVGGFFSCQVAPSLNQNLKHRSICGYPSVDATGSPNLSIGLKGSTVCPDQCFRLMQQDADGEVVYVQDTPRVILETSVSESRSHVMAKIMSCLHEMRGLQAAVVCDMKNIPRRTIHGAESSSKVAKPFLAEIAIWTRKAVGPLDPDPCYHQDGLGDHKLGDTVGFSGGLAPEQSHINSSSLVEGDEFDERAREYFRKDPRYPHQVQSIVRRSEEWITLYDASVPIVRGEPEPELVFDVYDFLRPCSRFPHRYILDRKFSVPLGGLRRRLILALQHLSGHHSVPKAGSLTRGFSPGQGLHGRKGRISSMTTHPTGMNFRQGLFTSSTSPLLATRSARSWTAVRPMATRPSVPLFARLLVPGVAGREISGSDSHDDDSEGSEDFGEYDDASIEDRTYVGVNQTIGVSVEELDVTAESQIMGDFDRKMKEIQLSNSDTQSLGKAWDFTITDYDPDNFDLQDELRQATGIGKRKGKGRARGPRQIQLSQEVNHFLGQAHSTYASGDRETAIKLLQDVITIEPGVANAWGTLAFCYEDLGDTLKLRIMAAHLECDSDQWVKLGLKLRYGIFGQRFIKY